jgi:HAD superfamily hydrolase (TIGR01549 family)
MNAATVWRSKLRQNKAAAGCRTPKYEVDALTFDFYNTLVHHRTGRGRGESLMEYLRECGLEADPWEHQVLYDVFDRHAAEYSPEQPPHEKERYVRQLAERVFRRLNVRAPDGTAADHAANLWDLLGPASLAVFPEVTDVLRRVKAAGYPMAVVSNWQCGLRNFCVELGFGHAFDQVLASAEVGSAKPDPAIFEEACRRLKVPAGRVLHIGDSLADDFAGGRNAGLQVVLVRREPEPEDLEAPTIPSLNRLPELLGL